MSKTSKIAIKGNKFTIRVKLSLYFLMISIWSIFSPKFGADMIVSWHLMERVKLDKKFDKLSK